MQRTESGGESKRVRKTEANFKDNSRSWGQKKRRKNSTIGQQYWRTGGQEERRTRGQNSMTEGQDASDREAVKNIGPPVAPVINMTNMVVFTAEIQI